MFSLIVSMQRNASVAKGPLVEIEEQPKKVAPTDAASVFGVVFSKGVESSEEEDGRSDDGEVDDELFKREDVILSLENVLVEGVEGDDRADVLDVLGRDCEHP